jgi:hypothetical protein
MPQLGPGAPDQGTRHRSQVHTVGPDHQLWFLGL